MNDELRSKPTWTVDDVLVFFEVSRDTLRRWRKKDFPEPRVLPGGRTLRWDAAEVLGWWDSLERAA